MSFGTLDLGIVFAIFTIRVRLLHVCRASLDANAGTQNGYWVLNIRKVGQNQVIVTFHIAETAEVLCCINRCQKLVELAMLRSIQHHIDHQANMRPEDNKAPQIGA